MTPNADMIQSMTARHAMVSFERPDQVELAAEVCQSIVLDNGAFSAWRSGKPHDFDGYKDWVTLWLKHPAVEWCVIPDVIDGDEEANDRLLGLWDLPRAFSVPVWHMHERLSRLRWLADQYPRVAIGSSGAFRDPGSSAWWERMSRAMDHICDDDGMPPCKLHGLRMLDPVLFSHLPLSSADSTNVARNVGIDQRWTGPYVPPSSWARALVLMNRIESHASARCWSRESSGVQHNLELLG
jgi:hypothetical protein